MLFGTPLNGYYIPTKTTPFYYSAFVSQETDVWGRTKFARDIMELTYFHALTCWLRDDTDAEQDRRELLRAFLIPQFGIDDPDDTINQMFSVLPSDNSYIVRTLRNMCYIYNIAPTRQFLTNDVENTDATELLNEILDGMKYDRQMQRIYRVCKFVNECAVRPVKRAGKYELEILTPDLYRLTRDDYGAIKEMYIPFACVVNGKPEQRFHVWTPDVYKVADVTGQFVEFTYNINDVIETGGASGITNPYGRIPYEFLELNDAKIYGGSMFELLKAQLTANKLDLLMDENVTFNGFSMFVGTNLTDDPNATLKLSPRRVFNVVKALNNQDDPIPPSLDVVSPPSQYDQIQTFKDLKMKSYLKNMGLPTSMVESDNGAVSGVAILRERQELTDVQNEDKSLLIKFENDLINLIIDCYNIENSDANIDAVDVMINYNDVETLMEPNLLFETERAKFEFGVITAREFLANFTDRKFETDEQAVEYIKTNKSLIESNENVGFNLATNRTTGDNGRNEPVTATNETIGANGTPDNLNNDVVE